MSEPLKKNGCLRKVVKLFAVFLMGAVALVFVSPDSVLALRAPVQIGDDIPYYYVSDGISDNGQFPFTYVGFYWNSDSGTRTIRYDPRKCNNGGYDDSSDGDPRVTIYGINANGTLDSGNILVNTTHINACHNDDSDTSFSFNLANTLRDTNVNMKGVVVRVDSSGDGDSRAWFSLESPDVDGVQFGVMGGRPVGYSRDFSSSSGGGYYNLRSGFGSCASTPSNNRVVQFFDTDNTKYQSAGSGDDNALRIQFVNLSTGVAIDNDSSIIHDLSNISRRSATPDTWFNLTANSAQTAQLQFNMAANTGYRLDINHLREGNDITVMVPTNEINGKRACTLEWSMRGYTNVAPTAAPGQQVTFTHHVVNNGPDPTNRDIWADTQVSGGLGVARASHNTSSYTASQDKTTDTDTITIPSNAQGGQQYCQRVGYQWTAHNNSAYSNGGWACVTVTASWNIGGSVTAYSAATGGAIVTTATPGQTVYFDYRLWNGGPNTSGNITYTTNGAVGNGSPRSLTAAQNIAARSSLEAVAIPANAPNGATYCRTLAWNPDTQAGGSGSAQGCVTVSYNYNLTPTVGLSGNSTVSQGETVRFMTTVGKSVQYPSNQTSWEIRRVIIPLAAVGNFSGLYGANRERSGAGFDGEFSCTWYVARGAECQEGAVLANLPDIGGGVPTSGTQIFVNNLTNVGRTDGYPEVVDAPLGTRICYALMVNSRDRDANNYREFMNCAVVAKHPALQVMNGDVRVGGNFTSGGACTLPITGTIDSGVGGNSNSILSVLMHNYGVDSTTRGSYGDYAATAPGLISRFGSGGLTYSNPSGVVAGKMLLFGSEGAAASSGNYASGANGFFHIASGISTLSSSTPTYCLPDLASNYNQPAATILATPLRDAETTNGSRRYVFNGSNQTLNIQATELTASQRTVIWVENNPTQPNAVNTVRIAGDITLPTGNINSVNAVPQFILIVNGNIDIKINENVASVYGVYSTRGSIYTCGDFDGRVAMTDANCTTTLRVNGALIAGQRVLPYRTAGYNNVTDGTYAETFNLHPGVLVSDYVRARSNGSTFVTDYQQELPTRL